MNFYKKNNGMALVSAVLIMLIVVLLGQSMILLTRHESETELRGRLYEAAFYVADAGVEKAILDIKNNDFKTHFTQIVGKNPNRIQGEADVSITSSGSYYIIYSTGHIPSISESRSSRTIRAVVEVKSGSNPPKESVIIGGSGNISSGVSIEGVIFSNGHITVEANVTHVPDKEGNCALYSAHTGTPSITVGTNYRIDRYGNTSKEEVRARGSITGKNNVSATEPHGVPLITEYDTSEDTEPKSDTSYLDSAALLASVTHTNYTFGGEGTVDANNRVVFNGNDINLDGGVYLYTSGVEFTQNVNFHGQGTIVVSTSASVVGDKSNLYDYGIELRQNVRGPGNQDYAELNLIVLDGNWREKDILLRSNIKINGLVSGQADISLDSNVDIKGILIAGGSLNLSSNIDIKYEEPAFPIPWKKGMGDPAGVNIISWREVR